MTNLSSIIPSSSGSIKDSEITPAEGILRKTGASAYTAIKTNLTAVVAPVSTNDTTEGYSVGSIWVDTVLEVVHICADATEDNAEWYSDGGANYLKKDTESEFTKTLNFNQTTLTDAATIAWDLESNQVCSVEITDDRTMGAPTNNVAGATYILTVIQDGTGGWGLSWNAEFLWENDEPPELASAPNDITIIMFKDDGTNLFGSVFWSES